MQQVIVEGRVNIAGGMAREGDQILARKKEADRFIVPKTGRAEAIEAKRKRGKKDGKKPNAGRRFQVQGRLFTRLGLEHDLFGEG